MPNELIKYESGLIKKVNNSLNIINKLLSINESLIPYRKKEKWGYCTLDKKIVIDCMYDMGWEFIEGIGNVEYNSKWGCINKHNEIIIPLIYSSSFHFDENNLARIDINLKKGFINRDGKIVISLTHDYID